MGHIRGQLEGGLEVAGPHLVSKAFEALIRGQPEPQPGGDLTAGGGVWLCSILGPQKEEEVCGGGLVCPRDQMGGR